MAQFDPKMSVEAYLDLEKQSEQRHEYIDGYVYALAGGTLNHAIISAHLAKVVGVALEGGPCGAYTSDARVSLSETRYVYPDLTVSCDEDDTGTADVLRAPRVVIEVLSPGTEAYDRGKKFDYYQECPTIQEYVLVDAQRYAVDVFRRCSPHLWTYHPFRGDVRVFIACLELDFPLFSIYERTRF